jgi:hypothetical protein
MDYYAPPTRECAALVIYTEARGEPWLGQFLVAKTLINRAVATGDGVCETAGKDNQFHGFEAKRWPAKFTPDAKPWAVAMTIASFVIEYAWNDHSVCGQPFYFHAGAKRDIWHGAKYLCSVGGHHFYGVQP